MMERSLRRALERGEFVLYYQPQITLDSGHICGAEALIRWQHPDRGLMRPACFIPVAEESGIIEGIGEWVLRTACAHHRAWRAAGLATLRLGVNLSACQLRQRGLVEKVRAALLGSGLDPGQGALELEVTEMILQTPMSNLQKLWELKELGILLTIDHFGTGHLSLGSLKHLPLNRLKIDRSFIEHLPGDTDDAATTSAIIAIGGVLGLTVLAEGVEKREQLEFLQARGCAEAQGYLFSEPMPEAQFRHLLGNWQGHSCLPETAAGSDI
jgi:EAL domain-containing protein (putative c-di-GMP-specific phosphodiesterase class I)